MDRRELLAGAGASLAAASLGGCLDRYGVPEEGSGGGGGAPTLAEESFEMTDADCGTAANDATVGFDAEEGTVEVTGTVPGADACHVARLAGADYDPDADSLAVTVESVRRDDAEACADCVSEIDYEASFAFDGGLPASVTVTHEALGETSAVASADPS
ncbi:hypothetical protein [Halorussus marinus]|uniref:hypothetical protein n=1 Tax=Halorussus marinus TaxID=2505976 RepID=UPI00106EF7CE|nr:hypothetical protein [Halorussus marinus]